MHKYITAALFTAIFHSGLVAENLLTLKDADTERDLLEYVHFLRDPGGALSFEDVSTGSEKVNFSENSTSYPAFGFTRDAMWGKFYVRDHSSKSRQWYLIFDYPLLDDVRIIVSSLEGKKETFQINKNNPFSDRFVPHRKIIVPLAPEADYSAVYFRIRTDETMELPLRIVDNEGLARINYFEMFISGIYYGIIGVMLFYNLFIYFTLRDKSYLYYILYLVSVLLGQAGLDGYLYELTDFDMLDKGIRVFAGSTGITFACLFSIYYLHIKTDYPVLYRFLVFYIPFVNIPILLFMIFGFYAAIQMTLILLALSSFLFLSIGARAAYENPSAGYYLLAWIFMLGGALIFGMKTAHVFIPGLTPYSLQLGSVFEVTILSFALGYRIRKLQNEKDNVTEVFGRTVAPEIRDLLLRGDIKLGGDEKKVTVLFTDIRNFTELSEKYQPETIVSILNRHFELVSGIVSREHGLVNKFIGDSAMALFNIPIPSEDHCGKALNTAISILESTRDLNREFEKEGLPQIRLGIGVHTGDVLAGNIGSSERMEYTVIGDTVNTASRIEQLTKAYRTPLLTTESIIMSLKNPEIYLYREVDIVHLKGKQNRVRVYEIFNADEAHLREQKEKSLKRYQEARELYHSRKFFEASEIFTELHAEIPDDHVLKIMAARCSRLSETPPGDSWTGSVSVTMK